MPSGLKNQAFAGAQPCTDGVAPGSWLKSTILFRLFLLTVGCCHLPLAAAPDPYASEFAQLPPDVGSYVWAQDQHAARERQELYRIRVPIPDAVGEAPLADYVARRAAREHRLATPQTEASVPPGMSGRILLFATMILLAGMLAMRRLVPDLLARLHHQFFPLALAPVRPVNFSAKVRAEEEGITAFFTMFQAGPAVAPLPSALVARSPDFRRLDAVGPGDIPIAPGALQEFQARAANILATQQSLLKEISRTSDPSGRHKLLAALRWEMHILKGEADLPPVLPVWQVASALEGLLKQLTDDLRNVTPSALRTVAGGVDLLDDLCLTGLNPSLLTDRPIKLLVVDNDSISRNAISRALQRAFDPPDLAADAATAHALTTAHAYDVIFLDVQMPGADGFEFCSTIHATVPNRTAPVVFVADQSDFAAHAQSTLSGGCDLIGKPFLTFELTAKALTLALRARLRGCMLTEADDANANDSTVLSSAPAMPGGELAVNSVLPETATDWARSSQSIGQGQSPAESCPGTPASGEADPTLARELSPAELAGNFLTRAAAQLGPLRELFDALFQTADEAARQEMLSEIYLCLHGLNPKPTFANLHPSIQLSAALQGLLRKLLEDPRRATPSTLVTLAAGVDLLHDLCLAGPKSSLIMNPPVSILVVDDDPLARRAVVCALQMAFDKPAAAESGEAALALATERQFDVIFLDVRMSGMDGFTTCSKIREVALNGQTPVVFVTGQSDFNARTQMSRSGGNDFVSKPFLKSEITVKALTFALRGRLEKIEMLVS